MFGSPLLWRETQKPPRFLIFEGRVVLVLLFTIMHLRMWTVTLAIAVMFVFWYFEKHKSIPADAILRYVRSLLIGPTRSARGRHEERLPVDFWFEPAMYLQALRAKKNPVAKPAGKDKEPPK